MTSRRSLIRITNALFLAAILVGAATSGAEEFEPTGPTPPRLALVEGDVSFYRVGAEDWGPARLNTPLAEGDELFVGERGNVELQIAPRAFVRARGETRIGLTALQDDFAQYEVTGGHAAFDVSRLPSGYAIEVATPAAAFMIDRPGYYRVTVDEQGTTFDTRRGGVARAVAESGEELDVGDNQRVAFTGDARGRYDVQAAAAADDWDRWNEQRTSRYAAAPRSAQYVSEEMIGADELDHYGDWRAEPTYGNVWFPRDVQGDWAPYSRGRWVYDPRYEWTWVDEAPWGWSPYHYGRWVHVGGAWGWAPGPIVARPVYAPALVAFFGAPGVTVSVGAPFVSWVALGWGEPVIPWWGGRRWAGRPYWGGWGGPRIVNNVVVQNNTFINVRNVHRFANMDVQNAVVGIERDRFGRGGGRFQHVRAERDRLRPLHGNLGVRPVSESFTPGRNERGRRPPERLHARKVVATRARGDSMRRLRESGIRPNPSPTPRAERRLVKGRRGAPAPDRADRVEGPDRAPDADRVRRPDRERPDADRVRRPGPERQDMDRVRRPDRERPNTNRVQRPAREPDAERARRPQRERPDAGRARRPRPERPADDRVRRPDRAPDADRVERPDVPRTPERGRGNARERRRETPERASRPPVVTPPPESPGARNRLERPDQRSRRPEPPRPERRVQRGRDDRAPRPTPPQRMDREARGRDDRPERERRVRPGPPRDAVPTPVPRQQSRVRQPRDERAMRERAPMPPPQARRQQRNVGAQPDRRATRDDPQPRRRGRPDERQPEAPPADAVPPTR